MPSTPHYFFLNTPHFALFSLILSSLLAWSGGIYVYLYHPSLFIDDAYIYLHIASNIIDVGTAQYYPIVNNESLLASSPLRMLILVPATALARLFSTTDYSFFTSQLTFIFSGILTTLLFLPWFWGKWHRYWAGILFTGLLSISTIVTMWQMEGALLFWCFYTLAWLVIDKPLSAQTIRQMGYISGLLLLSRPEYGVVTLFLAYATFLFSKQRWSWIFAYTTSLLIIAFIWILIANLLQVWFIPTTYLSKIITGKLDFFGEDFGDLLLAQISFYFFFNQFVLTEEKRLLIGTIVIAVLSLYGILISRQHRFYLLFAIGFIILTLLLYPSPGNYLWYYENYFVVFSTLGFFIILRTVLQQQKHYISTGFSIIFVVLFIINGFYIRFEHLPHGYIEKNQIYAAIAQHHLGNGLFKFPGLPETYISMMEIGVVSYLAGSSIWMDDKGGLAQAGTLEGTHQSHFAMLYPKRLLINGMVENEMLCKQDKIQSCLSYDAWAMQTENPEKYVVHYLPQYKIGFNPRVLTFQPKL